VRSANGGMEEGTLAQENLLAALESASASGDAELISSRLAELQKLIDRLQRRVYPLSQLQYRACLPRDKHTGQPD